MLSRNCLVKLSFNRGFQCCFIFIYFCSVTNAITYVSIRYYCELYVNEQQVFITHHLTSKYCLFSGKFVKIDENSYSHCIVISLYATHVYQLFLFYSSKSCDAHNEITTVVNFHVFREFLRICKNIFTKIGTFSKHFSCKY